MCSARPAARGRTPGLESGHGHHGVYRIEGIELFTQTAYVLKTCAPVWGPVSHLNLHAGAAAGGGAGSVPEIMQSINILP
jgi:hypothetical protein